MKTIETSGQKRLNRSSFFVLLLVLCFLVPSGVITLLKKYSSLPRMEKDGALSDQELMVRKTFNAEQVGGGKQEYVVVENLTNSAGIFLLIVKPKSPTENEPPIRCVISTFPIQNGDKVRLVHWQFSKPDAGAADNATMAVPITIRPL